MQLVLTRPSRRPAVARALVFIDESGRFCTPTPHCPVERPLVASVAFRDVPANRVRIASVAAELRRRHGPTVKGNSLTESDYELVTTLVRDAGYVCWSGVEYADDHPQACRAMLRGLSETLQRSGARVDPDLRVTGAIRRTREQLAHADSTNLAAYTVQVLHLLRMIVRWLRREGFVPDLRVTFDERLRSADVDLVRFLPRFAVAVEFPEYFGTRLSEVWAASPENTGTVSSDEACDGLILADAIAFAAGRVVQLRDPEGLYAARLAACQRVRD